MTRQGFFQLTAVQAGGAICLPMVMVGQMLGETYGLAAALLALVLGNGVLVVVACLVSRMSVDHRESTPEVARRYLGPLGARFFALTFMVALTGWFSIQLRLMGMSVSELIGGVVPLPVVVIGLGGLITLFALYGLRGITRLALLSMPLLIGTMGACAYFLRGEPTALSTGYSGAAISVVIAAAITAAFDLPTYFRHARGKKSALLSALFAFGVVLPLVESLGVYIGLKTPGMNLLSALTMQGGAAWTIWVLLFLVLAGWTTNNANLYSAGACLDLLRPSSAKVKTLALGAVGTGLALLPLLANFEVVLAGMGTLVIAVGATVLTAYLLRRTEPRRNVLACLLGVAAGFCALSGVALIDAAVVSGLATAILGRRGDETARA